MASITLVTDSWSPQVNGAVTTLVNTVRHAQALGHRFSIVEPRQFSTWPCPTYPEIPLARTSRAEMRRIILATEPDHVLIAIEGPLGLVARRVLVDLGMPFSTAFLTNFHDYLWHRFRIPKSATLRWLDWFHGPASRILTPTAAMQRMLLERGLLQARAWPVGVDTATFVRREGQASRLLDGLPRPILLYVGRVAVEKNVDAFLRLDLPGSKVVVGDGPQLAKLQRRYPSARYLGYRDATQIAQICSVSDVMVFPSRTDTFGHVIIEALACGLPVAAYPVRGPIDILTDPAIGAVNEDLGSAVRQALTCDRAACRAFAASRYRWDESVKIFLDNLTPVRPELVVA